MKKILILASRTTKGMSGVLIGACLLFVAKDVLSQPNAGDVQTVVGFVFAGLGLLALVNGASN